jgi:threonine dehydratase
MNSHDTTFTKDSPLSKLKLSEIGSVFLKEELRLTTNSYKIRGVTSFFRSIKDVPPSIEVLSAGNLAFATAYECQKRSIICTAIVPEGISEVKKKNLLSAKSF